MCTCDSWVAVWGQGWLLFYMVNALPSGLQIGKIEFRDMEEFIKDSHSNKLWGNSEKRRKRPTEGCPAVPIWSKDTSRIPHTAFAVFWLPGESVPALAASSALSSLERERPTQRQGQDTWVALQAASVTCALTHRPAPPASPLTPGKQSTAGWGRQMCARQGFCLRGGDIITWQVPVTQEFSTML